MKNLLKGLLILFLFLPGLLWAINSQSHRLGTRALQGEKDALSHMHRISASSYPYLRRDQLFLTSVSDPFVYEFSLEGPEYLRRYEIGGKDKEILYRGDELAIGYQENRIKNQLARVKVLDLTEGTVRDVMDAQIVSGEMSSNVLAFDGWFYLWGLEGKKIRLTWTNGRESHSELLNHEISQEEEFGFHLSLPIENLPVFEIQGDKLRAFQVDPQGVTELPVVGDRYPLPLLDEKFSSLIENGTYSRFYLQKDVLMARRDSDSAEWEERLTEWVKDKELIESTGNELEHITPRTQITDLYSLPDLDFMESLVDETFLYPEDLMARAGYRAGDNGDAVKAQKAVVDMYQKLLDENEAATRAYLEKHQFRDYLFTPTSLMLIFCQLIFFGAGVKILRQEKGR